MKQCIVVQVKRFSFTRFSNKWFNSIFAHKENYFNIGFYFFLFHMLVHKSWVSLQHAIAIICVILIHCCFHIFIPMDQMYSVDLIHLLFSTLTTVSSVFRCCVCFHSDCNVLHFSILMRLFFAFVQSTFITHISHILLHYNKQFIINVWILNDCCACTNNTSHMNNNVHNTKNRNGLNDKL